MKNAWCPGSMGELVQGIWEGKEVLVSLPINRFTEMEVNLVEKISLSSERNMQHLWKSRKAMEIALDEWGLTGLIEKIEFRRRRSIPEGKGYASSTADVAALLAALARLLEKDLREEDIARIALKIEPSDGVVFSKMCLFDHLRGTVLVRFPVPKYLGVVVIELPGTLDTMSVNRDWMRSQWDRHQKELKKVFDDVLKGLEEGDLFLIGKAATMSSYIGQSIFPEPIFEKLVEINQQVGGLGVNRAHTGKAFGVLFDARIYQSKDMIGRVESGLKGEKVCVWGGRIVSGGVRMIQL